MQVEDLLISFPVILFDQIEKELFFGKRKDKKFVFHIAELEEVLKHLQVDYFVVSHHEHLVSNYFTEYLDSSHLTHFLDHHHGKLNRVKYRMRTYEDGKSYFEIKHKRNTGHTLKSRVEIHDHDAVATSDHSMLLRLDQLKESGYKNQLGIKYQRITLYSKDFSEKITLDSHLQFEKDDQSWNTDALVIAESKMAQSGNSPFRECMKALHIRETSFSKYCFGIAKLAPSIKRNNFKQLLRQTEKLISKYEISPSGK